MRHLYLRQMLFLIIVTLAFLVVIGALLYSAANGQDIKIKTKRFFETSQGKINRFNNDVTVEQGEKIEGDVVVTNGTITVKGEISGNVMVFWGDIKVGSSGVIYGQAIAYRGTVEKQTGARIAGDKLEINNGTVRFSPCRDVIGNYPQLHRFSGEMVQVESDQQIDGDVVLLNGDINIDGEITGDVLAISGNIRINPGGIIRGHAISYRGKVKDERDSMVNGEILEIKPEKKYYAAPRKKYEEINDKIRKKIERKFLKRRKSNRDIVRFFGDAIIEENEFIRGDVVVIKGTIEVKGEVDGDVVAIMGDVEMDSTAVVDGDVVSVGGRIWRERGSEVTGDVVETSWWGVKVDDDEQHVRVGWTGISVGPKRGDEWERKKSWRRWDQTWDEDFDEMKSFVLRYNRVEGLFLGLRLPKSYWWNRRAFPLKLYGHAGYGFESAAPRYQIGLERWFFDDFRFTLGAEIHDLTDTQDRWIIPTTENSLAAFFLKEDFQDFYRREGFSGYVKQNFTQYVQLSAEFRSDTYSSMEKKTNWSLFGGKKTFRPNPPVDSVNVRSVLVNFIVDTRNDVKHPEQGWLIKVSGERAGGELKGERKFDRYIVDIRRYQPLGYNENLDFRLRVGTGKGVLPKQFLFDLGGISTLRGCNFKEFSDGDRMVLGNIEYRITGRRSRFNNIWWLEHFNLIFFADAGWAWDARDKSAPDKSFEGLRWSDLKTDIGVAFTDREGSVRLNFAKRTDYKGAPLVVTFRLNRAF